MDNFKLKLGMPTRDNLLNSVDILSVPGTSTPLRLKTSLKFKPKYLCFTAVHNLGGSSISEGSESKDLLLMPITLNTISII